MPKYCKVSNYNIKKSLTRKSHNRLTCKKTSKKSENSGLCTVRKSTKRCVLRGWDNKPKNIVRSIKGGAPKGNFPIVFKFPLAMFDDIRGEVLSRDEPNASNLDEEARDTIKDAIQYFMDGGITEQMKDINLTLNPGFDVKYLNNNDSVLVYATVNKDWSSQRDEIDDLLGNIGENVNFYDSYELEYAEGLTLVPSNNKFYKLTNVLLGDHDPVLDRFKSDSP